MSTAKRLAEIAPKGSLRFPDSIVDSRSAMNIQMGVDELGRRFEYASSGLKRVAIELSPTQR